MTLRIGNLELATNVALAPLSGYTDLAYRRVVRSIGGLGLATTELVTSRGLVEDSGRSREIALITPGDQPLAVQFYGVDAEHMAGGARWVVERGAAAIDINMGCPVRKIVRHGAGAAMLKDLDAAVALVARVVEAVDVPVTVKTRLGWSPANFVAPELVARLRDAGCAAITIHGRYAAQKFSGTVDLDGIRAVVEAAAGIPVFGNGDIRKPADALRMIEATGCAGVAIGRGALTDPWLVHDTHALLTTGQLPEPPSEQERIALFKKHLQLTVETKGERRACLQFRKWLGRYAKRIPRLRAHIELARTLSAAAQLEEVLG